ncbi:hypothetical protein [uncultured Nocardioides sp.]|uniref:hypothetical protein n=1 Tax=uncultured Nocardioides sp. TaxID=198441 RepID=UPI00262A01A3|nr:hypothetical protein [uncultured Nocardioides sp.]
MSTWIVLATVPSTVFDVYDVTEVLDELADLTPMLDGGTADPLTGRRRPWQVTVDVPAPTAHGAATTGVDAVEAAFGRRALGFEVITHAEHDARAAQALEDLRRGVVPAAPWTGPCVP